MRLKLLYSVILAFFAIACSQPVNPEMVQSAKLPTVFLYANANGELRFFNIEFGASDTSYQVERLANLGTTSSYFGGADVSWYNAYDMSKYSELDSLPRVVAVLNKVNLMNPTYNQLFIRQFIQVNESRRISQLQYYSSLNNKYEKLEQWNYPLNGDRVIAFIDPNRYLALYTDAWEKTPNVPRPVDIPYSGRLLHLLRYDFTGIQPELGEVITTFTIGDGRVDVFKDKPTAEGKNHLHVSAKGNFYIVWAPFFNEMGYSPYILRTDGTLAFDPGKINFTWENRYFGQSMFAFEAHPKKDSVFVMGDINYRSLKLVSLPSVIGSRFNEIKTKTISELIPQAAAVNWGSFQKQRAWFMTFDSEGKKLAITHALPGVDPVLVLWDIETDAVTRFKVNRTSFDEHYNEMGKAAFAYSSEGKSLIYFMAGDTTAKRADFFYINENSTAEYANRVNWDDDVTYRNLLKETPDKATDLVGR